MQKSLLSAEDIFAMKKDGECAIVVKGTDPLFETKCKMENTPFVKLLCRKYNPYDPKKRKAERQIERRKERGFFFVGKTAKEKAKELRENGVKVIRITADDAECMELAVKSKQEIPSCNMTEAQREMLRQNHKKYLEEHEQVMGYSNAHIRQMHKLIMAGQTAEEISSIISKDERLSDIKALINIL